MLRELHISNLAVIEDAKLELAPGLNCFTGMTGAGKSLIIGAIEVLLGLRPANDLLRTGCAEARIAGYFQLDDPTTFAHVAAALDLAPAPDANPTELLLTRRLFPSGRSTLTANGSPITAGMLKRAAERLIDIHGQHDHQYLLRPAHQLDVLDAFAKLEPLRAEYADLWGRWRHCQHQLTELRANQHLRQQQLDLYRFQADEIDAAQLQPNEGPHWTAIAKRLSSIERIRRDGGAVLSALEDGDNPLIQRAKWAASTLANLSECDRMLQNVAVSVREAAVSLQEAAFDLARFLDHLDVDQEALTHANERLTLLGKLASKYAREAPPGTDEASAVLAYRQGLAAEIANLETATADLTHLVAEEARLAESVRAVAAELTARRRKAAGTLAAAVEDSLADLGLPHARLDVRVEPLDEHSSAPLGPTGADRVEFLASTNPGLEPAPLRKIASGGELSRIMLALKGLLADQSRVSVLVFDEVDANVGGRLGAAIGRRLRDLSRSQQVLCITHLPQIACYADRHFTVRKRQTATETVSTVNPVEGDQRIAELAEMLGDTGPAAQAQARDLLRHATAPSPPATPRTPMRLPLARRDRSRKRSHHLRVEHHTRLVP